MKQHDYAFTTLTGAADVARALNRGCDCRSLDPERLRQHLEAEPALLGLAADIAHSRPHLFSATAVFMAPETLQAMADIVTAIEAVVALPAYQAEALARAPAIARLDPGPKGVFMGFDFHLGHPGEGGESGPQLIEINTNAGGALLNRALASDAIKTRFTTLSVSPFIMTREATAKFLQAEGARYAAVVKARGIKAE